jgi:ABC-2 type transport system permease protein
VTHRGAVWTIARWEFLRFFKWRELLVTIGIIVGAVLGAGPLIAAVVGDGDDGAPVRLAVDATALDPDDPLAVALNAVAAAPEGALGRYRFEARAAAAAEAALVAEDLDGVLVAAPDGALELRVPSAPGWTTELAALLEGVVVPSRLQAAGLAPGAAAAALQPVVVDVVEVGAAPYRGSGLIAVVVGALVFSVFTGAAVLFTVITGEKTQRVTEAIVSAVSPQAWIDGKILGTSLYVLAYLVAYAAGLALSAVLYGVLNDDMPALPTLVTDPLVALVTVAFAAFGFALWFTLFAAVAATVSDPTTSSRGGFLMLPGAALSVGFLGLVGDVDGWLFRAFALFPLTSPSALPVRMLAGTVAAWEVLLALALLVASVLLARRAAGRVFAFAIHMTGKEPSWGEIARWLRAR